MSRTLNPAPLRCLILDVTSDQVGPQHTVARKVEAKLAAADIVEVFHALVLQGRLGTDLLLGTWLIVFGN